MSFTPGFGLLVQSAPEEGVAGGSVRPEPQTSSPLTGLLTRLVQWGRRWMRRPAS